ncbi:hypothetical protein [Desulfosporosinus sp. BG]|uniref:hypothetical protein n=1 Tax=Desulfosporosinus sp. BG TaxID=1633135 RepID=UPI00083A3A07|nr:hypothetical protein [Desulfosporosinus sp. BG]ODA39458.1 hypothetical protein DSBG_3789 [Desulfosporosinus sp. BG]
MATVKAKKTLKKLAKQKGVSEETDDGRVNLEYIKNPQDQLIKLAIKQAGWAIMLIIQVRNWNY